METTLQAFCKQFLWLWSERLHYLFVSLWNRSKRWNRYAPSKISKLTYCLHDNFNSIYLSLNQSQWTNRYHQNTVHIDHATTVHWHLSSVTRPSLERTGVELTKNNHLTPHLLLSLFILDSDRTESLQSTRIMSSHSLHASGISISPEFILSMTSWGWLPSTVQPTDWHVPSTSFTVPERFLAILLGLIVLATARMSSIDRFPLCLMFFTFLRSLCGSFSALMISDDAEGTTAIVAWRFCTVSCTVTLRPFQSKVALAMSSPTFFGLNPSGPILGANADVAPTSPPTHLRQIIFTSLGSNLGGMLSDRKWMTGIRRERWMNLD